MASDLIKYPIPGFSFQVDFLFSSNGERKFLGPQEASFKEISGLKASLNLEEYTEMGFFGQPRSFITGLKFDNLVLKRGYSQSSKIANWFKECMLSQQTRHISIIVSLLGSSKSNMGQPIASWQFFDAFPVSIDYSGFNSMASEFIIETLELRYSHFTPLDKKKQSASKKKDKKPKTRTKKKKSQSATPKPKPTPPPKPKPSKPTPPTGGGGTPPPKKNKTRPRYMDSTVSSRAKQRKKYNG